MKKLTTWRKQSGHSMRELGRRIGVSGGHICRVLSGERNLSKKAQARAAEVRAFETQIKASKKDPANKMILEKELNDLIASFQ